MLTVSAKTVEALFWAGVSFVLATIVDSVSGLGLLVTFPTVCMVCAGVWVIREKLQVPPSGKAVLVTGCDSGFGHALALRLDQLGFRVFATCLFAKAGGEGALRLKREGSERLHVLQLDLTSSDQLDEVSQEVKRKLPDGEVFWGVVNNAGIALVGAVEWSPIEHFRRVIDVNHIGLVAVTKLFLPLIRQAKGRVVNVSSAVGRCSVGNNAPYVSSKYAVEGFSDCLRLEMKQFGVNVCLIEPGSHVIATKVLTREMLDSQRETCWSNMSEEVRAAYGETQFKKAYDELAGHGEPDITPVVDAMVKSLTQRFPRARYCTHNSYFIQRRFISEHLPEWVYDALYRPA